MDAVLVGLVGIGPKDELEGMAAAQLIAAHNAAIECYRRAMIGEQIFEGRGAPAVKNATVCRMHGAGGGTPKRNANARRHGHYSVDALKIRRELRALIGAMKATAKTWIKIKRHAARMPRMWVPECLCFRSFVA